MQPAALTLLWAIAGAIGFATLLGFLARAGWLCELACHFRLQYAIAAGVCGLAAGVFYEYRLTAASAVLVLINGLAMRTAGAAASRRGAGRPLRILSANVWFTNSDYQRILQLIEREQPDLVIAIEVTEAWLQALTALDARFPFSRTALYVGGFGIALYSRFPLRSVEVIHVGRAGLPSIVAHVVAAGQPWTIIATHPFSPKSPQRARLRDQQLRELGQLICRQSGPVVVVGDLNATPWSPILREVIRMTGLRDSRLGFGLQASWPVQTPFLRIPIDHCLVSEEIAVLRRGLGPPIGSDHFPVIIECAVALA